MEPNAVLGSRPGTRRFVKMCDINPSDTALDVYKNVAQKAKTFFRPMQADEVVVISQQSMAYLSSILLPVPIPYTATLPSDELMVGIMNPVAFVAKIVTAEEAMDAFLDYGTNFVAQFVKPAAHAVTVEVEMGRLRSLGRFSEYSVRDWHRMNYAQRKEYLSTTMYPCFTQNTLMSLLKRDNRARGSDDEEEEPDPVMFLISKAGAAPTTRFDFMHAASSYAAAGGPESKDAAASGPVSVLEDADTRRMLRHKELLHWDGRKQKSFIGGMVGSFLPAMDLAAKLITIRDAAADLGGRKKRNRSRSARRNRSRSAKRSRSRNAKRSRSRKGLKKATSTR
jgi:hypothetical protein